MFLSSNISTGVKLLSGHFRRRVTLSKRTMSDTASTTDQPVKYSTSKASKWKAEYSRTGRIDDDIPWFQPYIVSSSVAIFLYYFCVFREENGIDKMLEKSLYNRIGLEEHQVKASMMDNSITGKE